jgi:hypothetical protein
MDVIFFLKERTAFIRQLYSTTSSPYIERMLKIQNEEEPFVPLYSGVEGDGEPFFQKEFNEAAESLDTLRLMYISMLKSALHSYLDTWIKQSGISVDNELHKKIFKKKGWFWGYSNHFNHHFKIDFEKAPVDLKIIEEITLARNNIEHQESIADRPKYRDRDYKKLGSFLFVDKDLFELLQDIGSGMFLSPYLCVTEEQLLTVISTVEDFAKWFNNEIEPQIYPLLAKNNFTIFPI